MKRCTYCGKEHPDEATECMIDHQPLASSSPEPKSANIDFSDEVNTVVIRVFGSHEAAALAATRLESYGIECWINADDCGGMMPILAGSGLKLVVCSGDAEAATAILDSQLSAANPASEHTADIEPDELVRDRPKLVIVLGIWMIYGAGLIGNILVLKAALSGAIAGRRWKVPARSTISTNSSPNSRCGTRRASRS